MASPSSGPVRPFEPTIASWRLLRSGAMTGPENMACDQAILEAAIAAVAEGSPPEVTLRLYAWEPPAVSLGYHQKAEDVDRDRLRQAGIEVVRRPTGGRAIFHARELTYAVVGPLSLFGRRVGVLESYRLLSAAILAGLEERLGVRAELSRGKAPKGPIDRSPVACFQRPAQCDAVAGGKKVVGSAQVRRGECFLQHGSIPLEPREMEEREALLGRDAPAIDSLGSLAEAAGRPIHWQEAAEALILGFTHTLGVNLVEGELCPREREVMESLLTKVTVR